MVYLLKFPLLINLLILLNSCYTALSYQTCRNVRHLVSVPRTVLNAGFGAPKEIETFRLPEEGDKCTCNSGLSYIDCCKTSHVTGIASTPESLVRSRFSAYGSGNTEYIIDTTSPTCPDYEAYMVVPGKNGRKTWQSDIKRNMIDDFKYIRMEVVDVQLQSTPFSELKSKTVLSVLPDGSDLETADVTFRFLAVDLSATMYSIEEKCRLIKLDDRWLFEKSDVSRPPADISQVMMETWPGLAGVDIDKIIQEKEEEPINRRVPPPKPQPRYRPVRR